MPFWTTGFIQCKDRCVVFLCPKPPDVVFDVWYLVLGVIECAALAT
jgi:hypothetical protein